MTDFEIRSKFKSIYMELSEKHNFHCHCLNVVISNRLRSCNGYIQTMKSHFTGQLTEAKITMSKALLTEFGWERFETTFRHELAHLADGILCHGRGHSNSFKRLCKDFGGTMNSKMAGVKYADCAETRFVKPIVKWIYTCGGCGLEKKMAKRMNKRKRGSSNYRCGRCRTTLDNWKELRVV